MKFLVPLLCLVAVAVATAEVDPNLPLSYGLPRPVVAKEPPGYRKKVPVLASKAVPAKQSGYFIQQYHARYLAAPHRYSYVTFPRYYPAPYTYYGFPYQQYYQRYQHAVPAYHGYYPVVSSSYVHHYQTVHPQPQVQRPSILEVVNVDPSPPVLVPVPQAPQPVQVETPQRPAAQPAYTPAPETVPSVDEPAREPEVLPTPEVPDVPVPPRKPVQDAPPEPVQIEEQNAVPVPEPAKLVKDVADQEYPSYHY